MSERGFGSGEHEFSFRHLLRLLVRHRLRIVLCFAVLMVPVVAAVQTHRTSYRSEAQLLVKIGRESVSLDPAATTAGQLVDVRQDRDHELQAELAILQSPELCWRIVHSIGARRILDASQVEVTDQTSVADQEQEAVLAIRDGLQIELVDNSSVLSLAFAGPDAAFAQRVLVELIERFRERHLDVHRSPGSYEFFSQQSERLAEDIAATEKELEELMAGIGFAPIEILRSGAMERLAGVRRELGETAASISSAQAETGVLEEILAELPQTVVLSETVGSNPTSDFMRQRVNELKLEEKALAQTFHPESDRIVQLREQIREAIELLAQSDEENNEVTRGPNRTRLELELDLLKGRALDASLSNRWQVLVDQEAELLDHLQTLSTRESELTRLRRELASLEDAYQRYAAGLEQARVSEALETEKISNIRVIQPATLPLEPSGRSKMLLLGLGAVLSALGALAFGFICDRLDPSIRTAADVQRRLQLQTLATVPWRRSYRTNAPDPWSGAATNGHAPPADLSELSDLLVALGRSSDAKVVGVTSSRPGEGVSTVSAHLATALGKIADGSVLLVRAAGLSEASPGTVQATDTPNLHVLAPGEDAAPVLPKSKHFDSLLHDWRGRYDLVVVDLPAIQEPLGSIRLAVRCDAVLFVVAAEVHAWHVANHGRSLLDSGGASVLGTVLNKHR